MEASFERVPERMKKRIFSPRSKEGSQYRPFEEDGQSKLLKEIVKFLLVKTNLRVLREVSRRPRW